MIKITSVPTILCAAGLVLANLVLPEPAMAAKFLKTQRPISDVGALDPKLSIACQHDTFNQMKIQNLLIGYAGANGRGITGIATKTYNLRDRQGLARDDMTYHFYNDGYSDCQVYTARYRPPPKPK